MFAKYDDADKVHISVTFSWDLPEAERLEREWRHIAPVEIGGPATGQKGDDFTPGLYLKDGYVITSRGCYNRCWFCSVWKREGNVRELPITEGWNVLDDNLLACSEKHIRSVFSMLARQKHRPLFTGGLEAAKLKQWHVSAGFKRCHPLRAYVLIGYPNDTYEKAEARLYDCLKAGFVPMAMLYRDKTGKRSPDWVSFAWPWMRPAAIYAKYKTIEKVNYA